MPDRAEQLSRLPPAALAIYAAELEEALMPFADYAEKRAEQPLGGLADVIHAIHIGSASEASITLTDCNRAHALLSRHGRTGK